MKHSLPSLTRGSTAAFWALAFIAGLFITHPAAAASGRVDVKFRLVAFDSDISGTSIDSNGKPMPVEAHQDARSPFYAYSGPADLVIYRPGPLDKDGKPTKVTLATVDMSKAAAGSLVLLISDSSKPAGTGYLGFVMDDNYSDFPYGSIKFFNFTSEDDVVDLDGVTQTVKPTQSIVLKNKPKDKTDSYGVKVTRVGAQDAATVLQDNWQYRTDYRRLVFIVGMPNGNQMSYNAKWVDDQNLPPVAAPKPGSTPAAMPGGRGSQPGQGGGQGGQQRGGQQGQQRTNNNAGG